jgi:uncharacterized repeat protein (TIGR01451 family)
MARQAVVAALVAALAGGVALAGDAAPVSDLAITKTDNALTYTAGDTVTWTIVVSNAGPDAAIGATVTDTILSLAQVSSANWTCVADGGAACSAAGPVIGNIANTVDLPVGGTATFTLTALTLTTATGNLVNTATVAVAAGGSDPVAGNDTATDTDAPAEIFLVDGTNGTDSATCGTAASPCKTIQAAIDNAGDFDTVVVSDGTYNECPAIPAGRALRVESAEFRSSGTHVATILDGTDVCDPDDETFGPVITLTNGSMVRGVTIKGGGDSGVLGFGAVTITNNLITGNASTANGGGIRVSMAGNLTDPLARTLISANTVDENKSAGSGAGIFVNAEATVVVSTVEITGNTVTDNTAGDGTAGVLGGGITIFSDTDTPADVSRVIVTGNTVTGNVAQNAVGNATLGYGGGIYVVTGNLTGAGTETVTVGTALRANVVRNNVAGGFGGGMSIVARPAPSGKHTVDVTSNTVSANTANAGGGGLHLFLHAADRTAGSAPDAILRATNNSIIGNHALADADAPSPSAVPVGGGIFAELDSDRTPAAAVLFSITGNTIERNDASHGGGVSLLASADDDPDNDGNTAPTDAVIAFDHNLVAQNAANDESTAGASGGGVHTLAVARGGSATARIVLDFLTIASNETEVGSGGVEIEEIHSANSIGSQGTTQLVLSNSIVSSNEGFGVGGTVLPSPSASVAVSYTDAFGNFSGNYESNLGIAPGTNGNISVDPALDALFLPRLCGAVVDAGDPAIPATLEPLPNGGRVNLGHLGNTESATRTFPDVNNDGLVDGLDVVGIAVSFSAVSPDPRYALSADRDLNGTVDGEDLAFVTAFYAQSCP